ncbi:hypothetical protein KPL70_002583 [Citrus sinensis]|uniref:Uncharacterized protein n=1 Tax=Citrus sinensis TaxID=2711 RepID=A0ACB8MV61_CITSI|nr:hypothetical protein KPL70_002583 [Citrus sinensis]KAH9789797.1 hypothetical protein KPL71_003177 [Citrus sinensis]
MEQFYRLVPVERCDLYSSTSKDKQVRPQKPKHRRCLTPHVGNFGYLRFINLVDNNFRGEIPEKVGRLFRLEYLLLANNHFSVPPEFGYLSKLTKLFICETHLSGQLLDFIGNPSAIQKDLVRLDASRNHFSSEIPATLSTCTSLEYLNMEGNSFSGIILHCVL